MRVLVAVCVLFAALSAVCSAQSGDVAVTPLTDSDIKLLRSDVQQDKNQIITDTMQFTTAEAAAFWPVYRVYADKQHAIGDKRLQLIKDYAMSYDTLDDAKARDLVQRMINIEDETVNLREDSWPGFMKALGAKRAAKFYQVDSRLSLLVNLQLSAAIPLIP
jgi:hypothetical protein